MAGGRIPRLVLQARDRALLSVVEAVGVLDREQAKLAGPFNSTTRANARLLALTKAGLLGRTFLGTIAGGRKAVYVPPGRKRGAAAAVHLEHQLMVAGIYHAFRSCSQVLDRGIEWQTFTAPLLPGSRLIPDGLMKISTTAANRAIFVEADRGTEPLSVWRRKAEKYLELAIGGHHEQICGPGPFQVVVMAPGQRRCANIARTINSVTNKLFWITTAAEMLGRGPFNPIWLRPDGTRPTELLWS